MDFSDFLDIITDKKCFAQTTCVRDILLQLKPGLSRDI